MKTIGAHPHGTVQSAADRAVTDGWNAHGAGEYPSANPYMTDQPEHYLWRDGWLTRNQMCAERRDQSGLILFVAVGRNRAWGSRRSIIEATARAAEPRATGRLTATGFAAGTAGIYRKPITAQQMDHDEVVVSAEDWGDEQ